MNLRDRKGSISIFVLVGLLFMAGFLIISFGSNVNKSKTIKEQFNIISGIYAYGGGDEGAYDKAYTDLRKKNKQTMTASVENSNTIELTKTFEDKVSNYRIYGNTIQDGTPTPDTPVEVQSVGNKVNIFDKDQSLIEGIKNETEVSGWATKVLDNNWVINNLKPNITYTISYDIECIDVAEYDSKFSSVLGLLLHSANGYSDVATVGKQYLTKGEKVKIVKTFTTPEEISNEEADYSMLLYTNRYLKDGEEVLGTMKFSNIQIEEGAEATEYIPYGKYKVQVETSGRNLFDLNKLILKEGSCKISEILSDGIKVYTKYAYDETRYEFTAEEDITLTFSYKSQDKENYYGYTWISIDGDTIYNVKSGHVLNLKKGNKVTIRFAAHKRNSSYTFAVDDNIIFSNIQLEEGNTVTTYEPYKEQNVNIYLDEPLRKLGEYSDYIDLKTGKVVRNIRHIVLSESNMTWSAYDDNQEDVLGFYTGDLPSESGMARTQSLSNRFVRTDADIAPQAILGVNYETFYTAAYLKIAISKERVTDLDTFKTWLEQNPTYVDYILESPVEENISLPELSTYEDYTKIEVLTEVAPSKIEVEYIGYTLE